MNFIVKALFFRVTNAILIFPLLMISPVSTAGRTSFETGAVAIGPAGGEVRSLAYHPADTKTIYAAVGSLRTTIFKTRDGGRLWTSASLIQDTVWDLAIDPKNPRIIYALGDYGFYKSVSGAEDSKEESGEPAWTAYSLGSGRSGLLGKVFVHPQHSNIIYASGNYDYKQNPFREGIAFFKSLDGGKTWKTHLLSKNSYYGDTLGFAMSPSNPNVLYISGYYGIGPHTPNWGVFRSKNGGEDWIRLPWNPNLWAGSIVVHPTDPNRVWVTDGSRVRRSRDGGQTWKESTALLDFGDLAIDGSNPDILYSGADFGNYVSKSRDGGVTWARSFGVYGECLKMLVIDKGPNPGQTVFFGSLGGIFRSTNGGASWAARYSGIKKTVIPAVALAPSAPRILYAQARSLGVMKSPDAGKTWERLDEISRCGGYMKIAVHPTNAKDLIVLSGG